MTNGLQEQKSAIEVCLEIEPENANALHYLGILLHQTGQSEEALALVQRSLDLDPGMGPWFNNLGNVLLTVGRYNEAAAAYEKCAELDLSNTEVLNNLGVLNCRLGQHEKGIAYLERAISDNPKLKSAYFNLATVLTHLGRTEEAFFLMADALALGPQDPEARRSLALLFGKAGRLKEAREACDKWLLDMPDDPRAQHIRASMGGISVPERASDSYIEAEFDGFAASFDAKLSSLDYKAPQLVGQTVARLSPDRASTLQVLDIGCGTGLCASYLKPYAKTLMGVDLSSNMLELAKERNLYDVLIKAELVHFLTDCGLKFDLVVSADTLIYFGRLEAAFCAVHKVLRAGGHWIFTVEAHEQADDFVLHVHGRYSHTRHYLESALLAAGFQNLEFESVVLRFESSKPVVGWLVNAQADSFRQDIPGGSAINQSGEILTLRSSLQ